MCPNGGGSRLPRTPSTQQSGAWHPRKQQYSTSTAVRTSNLNSCRHPLNLSASYAAGVHILLSTYPASSYFSSRPHLLYFSCFAHSIASANFSHEVKIHTRNGILCFREVQLTPHLVQSLQLPLSLRKKNCMERTRRCKCRILVLLFQTFQRYMVSRTKFHSFQWKYWQWTSRTSIIIINNYRTTRLSEKTGIIYGTSQRNFCCKVTLVLVHIDGIHLSGARSTNRSRDTLCVN